MQFANVPVTRRFLTHMSVNLTYIYSGFIDITVRETVNGSSVLLSSVRTNMTGVQTLSFTPSTASVTLEIAQNAVFTSAPSGGMFAIANEIPYERADFVPRYVITQICNQPKDKYPMGFNGQMKDNEIAGMGNHNTALFWEYDTRLGRRWNLDPVDQVSSSNYSVLGNSPILNTDPLGNIINVTVSEWSKGGSVLTKLKYDYSEKGGFGFYRPDGTRYEEGDPFAGAVHTALNRLSLTPTGNALVSDLMTRNEVFEIKPTIANEPTRSQLNGDIKFNLTNNQGGFDQNGKNHSPSWLILGHEMAHTQSTFDKITVPTDPKYWKTFGSDNQNAEWDELTATHIENKIRAENGMSLREYYGSESDAITDKLTPAESTRLLKHNSSESKYIDANEKVHYNGLNSSDHPYNYGRK